MYHLLAQLDIRQIEGFALYPRFKIFNGAAATPAETKLGIIITETIIPYIFLFAGIILLFTLISGGYSLFLSAGDEGKIKKAHSQITNAIVGFLILFMAYWLVQIIEAVLGITIF